MHPIVRVEAGGAARVVARSGYVSIQGAQANTTLWPHARAFVASTERTRLPAPLARALTVEPGREAIGGLAEWNLGYWVAAADQRAGHLAGLNDGAGSTARIDASSGTLTWAGPAGRDLARDLFRHAQHWLAAGAPAMEDHRHRFVPVAEPAPVVPPAAGWTITRVDHHQVIKPPRP
jgi:hypothetical protein